MAETHVIVYELTDDMADAAADAVIDSTPGLVMTGRLRSLVIQLGIYGFASVGVLVIGIETDQPWWFFVAPAAMLALVAVVGGAMMVAYLFGWGQRKHLGDVLREAIRGLDSVRVRWTITAEQLTIQSGKDVREIRWADVTELSLTGTFWLLTVSGSPTMLLAGNRLPEATARFVLACAQRAGTRIRVAHSKGEAEPAVRADFP